MIGGRFPTERGVLIKHGYVLTLDPALGDLPDTDVLIEGDTITSVGRGLEAPAHANVIDARHRIVLPGFVDTHRHMWEGILRNIGVDVPLEGEVSYLAFVLGQLSPAYRPEDVYAGNLISAYGALNAGVTTITDWSHIQSSPEHTDSAIAALKEAGIRSMFAYGPKCLHARLGAYAAVPHALQNAHRDGRELGIVVDDQHQAGADVGDGPEGSHGARIRWRR